MSRADECLHKMYSELFRHKSIEDLSGPCGSWFSHLFYVNHYFLDRSDMCDYVYDLTADLYT